MLSIIDAFGIKDQKILNDKKQLISFLKLTNNTKSDNTIGSINNQAVISTITTLIRVIYSIEKQIINDEPLLNSNVNRLNREHLKTMGFNDDAYDNYEHFADTDDNNNNISDDDEEEDDEDASESSDSESSTSESDSASETENEIEKPSRNAKKDTSIIDKNENNIINGINNKETELMNEKIKNGNIADNIVDDNTINIINNNDISSSNNSSSSEGFEYDDVIVNSGDEEEDLNDDLNPIFDSLTRLDSTKHSVPTNFTYNYKPQQKTNLKIPANISANEKNGRTITIVNWKDTPLSQIALRYNVSKSVIGPTLQVLRDFEKKNAKLLQEKIKKNRELNEERQLRLSNKDNDKDNHKDDNNNKTTTTNNYNNDAKNIINNGDKTSKLSKPLKSRLNREKDLKSRSDAHKIRLRLRNKRRNNEMDNSQLSNRSTHFSNNYNSNSNENNGKFNNSSSNSNNNNHYDSDTSSESVYDPNFKSDDEKQTEKLSIKNATLNNLDNINNNEEHQSLLNEMNNGVIKRKSDNITNDNITNDNITNNNNNHSNNGNVKRVKFSDDVEQYPINHHNHHVGKSEISTSEVSNSLYNLLKTSSNDEKPYEGFVLSLEDSKRKIENPIDIKTNNENEESNKSDDQVPSFAYALTSNGQYQCKSAGCTAKPFSQYIQLYKHKATQHPQELPS